MRQNADSIVWVSLQLMQTWIESFTMFRFGFFRYSTLSGDNTKKKRRKKEQVLGQSCTEYTDFVINHKEFIHSTPEEKKKKGSKNEEDYKEPRIQYLASHGTI